MRPLQPAFYPVMASSATLGNLVRLVPIALSELPEHPALTAQPSVSNGLVSRPGGAGDLGTPGTGRPPLLPFVKESLDQATSFVDDVLPRTFSEANEKTSSPAAAKVTVLKRELDRQQLSHIPWATGKIPRQVPLPPGLRSEAWFARRSCHANRSQTGTASFAEFERGLLVDHSEHEQEYTPDVYDAHHALNWDVETLSSEFAIGEPYSRVRMCSKYDQLQGLRLSLIYGIVYEMCHKLPWPLAPRVFPVLVVLAKTGDGFIVLQVPISLESLPASFYSSGRNLREGDSALKKRKPVLGWGDTHHTR